MSAFQLREIFFFRHISTAYILDGFRALEVIYLLFHTPHIVRQGMPLRRMWDTKTRVLTQMGMLMPKADPQKYISGVQQRC